MSDREIALQVCDECGEAQYPRRDVCRVCLSGTLVTRQVSSAGHILSLATVHVSLEPDTRLPQQIASVQLDSGPLVIAVVEDKDCSIGKPVMLTLVGGRYVAVDRDRRTL